MSRKDTVFVAAVVGAALLLCGVYGVAAGWVFVTGGLLLVATGLLALGARGAALVVLLGLWVTAASGISWASEVWNLLASGLVALALSFTGAAHAAEAAGG